MERLLITGIDTLVGSNLALQLAPKYSIVGLHGVHRVELAGCESIACDLNDPGRLALAVYTTQPKWIIHCGRLSRSSWDQADQQPPPATESLVAFRLADTAREIGCRLAVINSDCVVSGRRMFTSEDSPVAADTGWAKTARDVEMVLAKTDALVVRTHAYGWSPRSSEISFAEFVHQTLTRGRPMKSDGGLCTAKPQATPILATDLADLVMAALNRGTTGVLHLGGAERVSASCFAEELAAAFGLRRTDVFRDRHQMRKSSSHETSLDSTRARRLLDTPMPMVREGLARFAAQASTFRWQLHGGEGLRRVAA